MLVLLVVPCWLLVAGRKELAVTFDEPVLMGPASTSNGTVCGCDFVLSNRSQGGAQQEGTPNDATSNRSVVCAHHLGVPWVPKHVYSACDGGAQYFFDLGRGRFFGAQGTDTRSMRFYTSHGGDAWQIGAAKPSLPAAAIGLGGNAPGSTLIPGPEPGQLHSTGELGLVDGIVQSSNSTVMWMQDGTLKWKLLAQAVRFNGAPLSAQCAYPGHVNSMGLRTHGCGITRLADGSLFATLVGCLNGAARTPSQPSYAASLLGFRSTDSGFEWQYVGPIIEAAAFPSSAVGPTENAVTLLSDNKTLLAVARTDGDGGCVQPSIGHYHEYQSTTSTNSGLSWTSSKLIAGPTYTDVN
jgi:hypothetical protein